MEWFNGKLVVKAENETGEIITHTFHDCNTTQATAKVEEIKALGNKIIDAIYYPSACTWF